MTPLPHIIIIIIIVKCLYGRWNPMQCTAVCGREMQVARTKKKGVGIAEVAELARQFQPVVEVEVEIVSSEAKGPRIPSHHYATSITQKKIILLSCKQQFTIMDGITSLLYWHHHVERIRNSGHCARLQSNPSLTSVASFHFLSLRGVTK